MLWTRGQYPAPPPKNDRYKFYCGGETGLTGYGKDRYAVSGEIPPLSVQIKMSANDNNVAPVAIAA